MDDYTFDDLPALFDFNDPAFDNIFHDTIVDYELAERASTPPRSVSGDETEIVGHSDTVNQEQEDLMDELFGSDDEDNFTLPTVPQSTDNPTRPSWWCGTLTIPSIPQSTEKSSPPTILQIDGGNTPPKKGNNQKEQKELKEQAEPTRGRRKTPVDESTNGRATPDNKSATQDPVTPPNCVGQFSSPQQSTYSSPYAGPTSGSRPTTASSPSTSGQYQPQAFFNQAGAGNPVLYSDRQQTYVGNTFNGTYPAGMMPTGMMAAAYGNGYVAPQQGRPSPPSFTNAYGGVQLSNLGNGYIQGVPTPNYGNGYPGPQLKTPSPNSGYSYPDPRSGNTPPGFSSSQASLQQRQPSPNSRGAQPNTFKSSPQSDNGLQLGGSQQYNFNISPQNCNASFQQKNASSPQGLGLPAEIVNNAPLSEAEMKKYLPNNNTPRPAHECGLPIDPARMPEYMKIVKEMGFTEGSEQFKAMVNTVGQWEFEEVYIDPAKLRSASAMMERKRNSPVHVQARKDVEHFKSLVRDGKKAEADQLIEDMVAKLHGPEAMALFMEHKTMGDAAREQLGPEYEAEEDSVFPFPLRHGFAPVNPADTSPEACAIRDKWFTEYRDKYLKIDLQEAVIRKACHAYTRALIKHRDPRAIEIPKVPLMPIDLRGELSDPDAPATPTPKRGKRKSVGGGNMESSPSPMKKSRAPSRKRVVSQAAQAAQVARFAQAAQTSQAAQFAQFAPVAPIAPVTPPRAPAQASVPAGLEGTLNALTNAVERMSARIMILQGEMDLIKAERASK